MQRTAKQMLGDDDDNSVFSQSEVKTGQPRSTKIIIFQPLSLLFVFSSGEPTERARFQPVKCEMWTFDMIKTAVSIVATQLLISWKCWGRHKRNVYEPCHKRSSSNRKL